MRAAAKQKLRKIRLTPATNLRIMTVSVKAVSPLIKTCNGMDGERILAAKTPDLVAQLHSTSSINPNLDAHATPRTIDVPAPRDLLYW